MSQAIPLSFDVASLEPGWVGTFPEFLELLPDLISVSADQEFALFVAGAAEPPYDSGPWAKNGNEWRYFDESTGDYQPFLIPQVRLKYHVGTVAPDADDYLLYFEFVGTTPTSIKGWNGTAWTAFHYLKSELYTKTEIDGLFESYDGDGKAQVDWDNVLNKPTSSGNYPARAESNVNQSVQANGVPVKVAFANEIYDYGNAYNATTYRYTAPASGIYRVSWATQTDNDNATAASMTVITYWVRNGGPNVGGGSTAVGTPPGSRWFVNASMEIHMNEGDYIELWTDVDDGVGTGFVDFSNCYACISLVEAD